MEGIEIAAGRSAAGFAVTTVLANHYLKSERRTNSSVPFTCVSSLENVGRDYARISPKCHSSVAYITGTGNTR
ncbi:uncharacterized protein J3R85_006513 [Psidium guajava]|nr:uncharacterized protein J3R85_006513 [Psidium guajava]